ncbi:bacterio-opsin activator [Halobacteriales archaeon QH_8_64_26]|nr:MAG: bacterio-opsin activator [Halobacteriales archaeon QH_8_64_26]
MTVLATIEIASEAFDLGQVFAGTDARIELTEFVPVEGRLVPLCWVDTDAIADRDRFEHGVESDGRVAAFDRLDGTAGWTLYRLEWTEAIDGFLDALADEDLIVERGFARAGTDAWTIRLRALDHEALTRFQHQCADHGIEFDVRRVTHDSTEDEDPCGLTDKQREALTLAFDAGYFDVPREISLSELADRLGISRQAYTRRLNRALGNYLAETGIDDLERPEGNERGEKDEGSGRTKR